MRGIEGKTAIITGGASGIGRATARRFASEGADVMIADVDTDRGREVVEDIVADGGTAAFLRVDVREEADVRSLVETTVDEFGRLDFAYNNAGIDGGFETITEQSSANYRNVVEVNQHGVFYGLKYEIPAMLNSGGGAVVNTSSVAGLRASTSMSHYVASKHAVIGLTRAAAMEYGSAGVRVNAVTPGAIQTRLFDKLEDQQPDVREAMENSVPIGRLGDPEEVAGAVVWLCSEDASYINGHPLAIDGGLLAQDF